MEDHGLIAERRDDLNDSHRETATASYRLRFGREGLNFERLELADPVPTGRQILNAAGVRVVADWALLALLPGGDMEEIRADETVDLRPHGVERVIGFRTDRLFRATLLDRPLLWGRQAITGEELHELAAIGESEALYVDVPGGTDRHVLRSGSVDLAAPGVERIIAGPQPGPVGFDVTVIYNGLARVIRVRPSDTAASLIAAARPLFGNPVGDLVLVGEAGQQLAPERTLGQQGVQANSRLQLRPPVVQGG